MPRPNHLNCVNTADGIRRINEAQASYDKDPAIYERREKQAEENRAMELEQEREWLEQNR